MLPADDSQEWLADRLLRVMQDDTTSGHEDRGLGGVVDLLRDVGGDITTQTVEHGSTNVLATWGEPRLLFTTHLDTVPPYLPPHREGDVIYGRGSCDAKGQMVAHLLTIRALLAEGHSGFAWLGVCREETDGAGAWKSLEWADRLTRLDGILNGEPTENRLGAGQRGFLHLRIRCSGRPAHSGTPELGRSATWPLLDWLQRIRESKRPSDPTLGPEVWNLGIVDAGDAINVIPERAEADLLARTLPGSDFEEMVRSLAPTDAETSATVERVTYDPPDRFPRIEGHEPIPLSFGSDLPKLRRLVGDKPVALVGPGSISVAHTEREQIRLSEVVEGSSKLKQLALLMLGASK